MTPPKPVSKQLKEGPFAFFRVLLVRPQSTTALIESAEERRFRKTDETSRTLEEFAFGFEGERLERRLTLEAHTEDFFS